jgi:Na+-transporting NADH:ubiquinone oxidoreductase subunit C
MIKRRIFSVAYMFGLTLLCTAVVSGIHELNRERIAVNEEIKMQEIVLRVLGIKVQTGASSLEVRAVFENRVRVVEREGRRLYQGFAEDGKTPIGYAFPLSGPGFWGPIHGMMAVDPELKGVIGVSFYRHSETPGLGGRITEGWFEDQFAGRALHPLGEGERYFYLVPEGTSKADNELDAITGATGTSHAVERLIDRSMRAYLPWIAEQKAGGSI